MKRILVHLLFVVMFLLSFSKISFAYDITEKDLRIINNFEERIFPLIESGKISVQTIVSKIQNILDTNNTISIRIKSILETISKNINDKYISVNTDKDSIMTADDMMNHTGMTHTGETNHLGCGENEVSKDGKCIMVEKEKSNISLFDQDLDSFVTGTGIIDGDLRGFMVEPKIAGEYPAVLMIHEWWGLNDNIKYMAELLAKQGYRVLAIDLYGGVIASDSDMAKKLSGEVRANPDKALEKMKKAVTYLKQKSSKVASLGWCFGGQQSLNISLSQPLDASVIYYGHLTSDKEKLAKINGPVLGIFGEKDTGITVESVKAFESTLKELGKENSITIYPGVGHAFANPTGANYAEKETVDAWKKTLEFLEAVLKN